MHLRQIGIGAYLRREVHLDDSVTHLHAGLVVIPLCTKVRYLAPASALLYGMPRTIRPLLDDLVRNNGGLRVHRRSRANRKHHAGRIAVIMKDSLSRYLLLEKAVVSKTHRIVRASVEVWKVGA